MGARRVDDDDREIRQILKRLGDIHTDVHPLIARLELLERGQTAIHNKLGALDGKIDKLTPAPGGDVVTEADKALMAASIVRLQALSAKAKSLDEMTS